MANVHRKKQPILKKKTSAEAASKTVALLHAQNTVHTIKTVPSTRTMDEGGRVLSLSQIFLQSVTSRNICGILKRQFG